MNIFLLDDDLELCAQYHVDKHVVKMPIEYAQMLCTAVHVCGPSGRDGLYRACHINHPCTQWARESVAHWKYLRKLAVHVGKEFRHRYGGWHKSTRLLTRIPEPSIAETRWLRSPPSVVLPDCLVDGDTVESYRNYYRKHKTHIHSWTKRSPPPWL